MDEEVKKTVLENFQRLVARIKELKEEAKKQEEKIMFLTNQLAKPQSNQCWWDGELCQRCSEIHGLQDCGITCFQCPRLDKERFLFVMERVFTLKEDGLEEEEALQEIHEKILDLMAGVGVEPAD